MTAAEQDRFWHATVYDRSAPQLSIRAIILGIGLAAVLSVTNLYISAKVGATLGVALTASVCSFGLFRVLQRLGLQRELHLLENTTIQTMASAAGYIVSPLTASMAAYLMVTQAAVPWWQMVLWLLGLSLLGMLIAIPLKRRFVNEQPLSFPEGRASAYLLRELHGSGTVPGLLAGPLVPPATWSDPLARGEVVPPPTASLRGRSSTHLLFGSLAVAALVKLLQSQVLLDRLRLGSWHIPEHLDSWWYRMAVARPGWLPTLRGIPLRELTVRPTLEIAMLGVGGMMGIEVGISLLLGAVMNYCVLAPWMVQRGDIVSTLGDGGLPQVGFRAITAWSLWIGVAILTSSSLCSLLRDRRILFECFDRRRKGREFLTDHLRDLEIPLRVSLWGLPLASAVMIAMAFGFFHVPLWLGSVAVPVVLLTAYVGVNATAQTSMTPTGALGKLSQLVYGVVAPRSLTTNLVAAGVSAEVALQASTFLQNLKPGFVLGANPRRQAVAHALGTLVGAASGVTVFYLVFLRNNARNLISESFPFPAAVVWKAVAEVLTRGLGQLALSAGIGALVGGLVGILVEVNRGSQRTRLPISPVGLGLAFVIPFDICLALFLGAFAAWLCRAKPPQPPSTQGTEQGEYTDAICAGMITGAALMGIIVAAIEVYGS